MQLVTKIAIVQLKNQNTCTKFSKKKKFVCGSTIVFVKFSFCSLQKALRTPRYATQL